MQYPIGWRPVAIFAQRQFVPHVLETSQSELILNPDGSIYHLGLLPEHVCDLIVTVGDPERVSAVSRHFDTIDFRQNRREFRTHVGRFAGRRIMCISTGIGTDNVDIVLNELDALANVNLETAETREGLRQLVFVRLGTSGTFQDDVPVDTILLSVGAVGLDGLGPNYPFKGYAPAARLTEAFGGWGSGAYGSAGDVELLDLYAAGHPSALRGLTLTCAGFYGPQRRSIRLPFEGPSLAQLAALRFENGNTVDRFTNFEMETAGIYGLASLLGHRALSVSAILANRATGVFSEEPQQTVERMIESFFSGLRQNPTAWFSSGWE